MPRMEKKAKTKRPTFLEYVIERHLGPPAYRGVDNATWVCPFHNDHYPSFATRPHTKQYKDRWTCFGCGERGDELDFLRLYFPNETYNARLERLRKLRAEYDGMEKAIFIHRGQGSTAGVTVLHSLFRAGVVDHSDLLEMVAELNCLRWLAMEWERFGRKGKRVG